MQKDDDQVIHENVGMLTPQFSTYMRVCIVGYDVCIARICLSVTTVIHTLYCKRCIT